VDRGLTNGVRYFYQLEDIETTGRTKRHGPVEATPSAEARRSPESGDPPPSAAEITYGDPSAVSLRVLRSSGHEVLLELATGGFFAEPRPDGSVRLRIPDFEEVSEPGFPALPLKRAWVEAVAGRRVRVTGLRAEELEVFSLRPSPADAVELIATTRGTVRAGRRPQPEGRAFRRPGLYPEEAARSLSVGFQGEVKKALVELCPLRWDGEKDQLILARRLTVRLSFSGREESERESAGRRGRGHREEKSHQRSLVAARLTVRESGLHGVSFEEVMGGSRRAVAASSLRLSRLGQAVAFHLEPDPEVFRPGSMLYFLSEGASLNPYGAEAVYELEHGGGGVTMPAVSAHPSGPPVPFIWAERVQEQNRYYQAALVAAEDLWFWDLLFAPVTKSYPFELADLVPVAEPAKLLEANAEELASGLLASRDPRRIYLGRLGVEQTRQAILDAFDQGASLMSYMGHGGIHLWAQENIFDTSRVSSLSPRPRQPLVLTLNCLNGYFHFPYFNSLGEELAKAEGKAALAVFSPSGLSLNEPAHRFHTALLAELLGGRHARLGDAMLASQAIYAQSGALPELLRIYHLLGDPALKIR
jgi:hypothetical protein